jgi:hypothetical protein
LTPNKTSEPKQAPPPIPENIDTPADAERAAETIENTTEE